MTDAEIEFDVTVEDFWKIVAELEKVVEKWRTAGFPPGKSVLFLADWLKC